MEIPFDCDLRPGFLRWNRRQVQDKAQPRNDRDRNGTSRSCFGDDK